MFVFGELLKGYRERAGLTQQGLADQLQMSRNTISAWERCEFLPQTRETVLRLREALYLSAQETDLLLYKANYPLEFGSTVGDKADGGVGRTKDAEEMIYGYLHLSRPVGDDRCYLLRRHRLVIGRHPAKCDLLIPPEFARVSREHAIISRVQDVVYLDDISKNGTFVDGQRVLGRAPLQPGQHILLGGRFPSDVVCVLEFSREPYSTK